MRKARTGMTDAPESHWERRTCPFCESSCGLLVEASPATRRITSVRGDPDHPLSHGYTCPKAQAVIALQNDGDRLRKPVRRIGSRHVEIEWDEAVDFALAGLRALRDRHGPGSIAIYAGNPLGGHAGLMLSVGALGRAVQAPVYSCASIDCFPRFLTSIYMYGNQRRCPVPDLANTDLFVIFGANPLASNGSLMGAPDMPRRLRELRGRGGRLVVVDPRKTETARIADRHVPVRPGADAMLIMAMIDTMFAENLVAPGRLAGHVEGLETLRALAARYPAGRVGPLAGVEASVIRELAREIAGARSAAVYGRIGTNCQAFGSLATWLIDCLNVLTGNLDRAGGVLFTRPALPGVFNHAPYVDGQPPIGLLRSRRSLTPSVGWSLPVHSLWEDMDPAWEGRYRGFISIAGNPAVSHPNSRRVAAALADVEFMVSHDIYLNETSRFADVVLPSPPLFRQSDFSLTYGEWATRDVVCHAPALFGRDPGERSDWELITELAAGMDDATDLADYRRHYAAQFIEDARPLLERAPAGMTAAEMLDASAGYDGEDQLLDVLLRTGPQGDGYGAWPDGLSLAALHRAGGRMDFGPMEPGRIPEAIERPGRRIQLAPEAFVADLDRLEREIAAGRFDGQDFLLINRRDLRSNNSWFHNLPKLVSGRERHLLMVHPDDAESLGVQHGERVTVTSAVHSGTSRITVSEDVRPGTVSMPHGWGQRDSAGQLSVASRFESVNVNLFSDDREIDVPSGNAVFNGLRVKLRKA